MTTTASSTVLSGLEDLEKYSMRALRLNTIVKISNSLNPMKVLPTDEGLLRDWRGLAQLAGVDGSTVMRLSCKPDPTAEVFKLWNEMNGQNEIISIGLLRSFLSQMDRWDVVDDTADMFEQDVRNFIMRQENVDTSRVVRMAEDKDILTVDDVCRREKGLQPQNYDAYLLFADDDVEFAMQIVDKMENEYKLKLCVKDRDLVGGLAFEHEAIMKLIAERCNRLIVVVSPNFLRSEANKFFVTFAQALGIEQRQRKVVPCLYQRCQLPPELSYYFLLDFNRAGKFWNFWEKLRDSIQTPNSPFFRRVDAADAKLSVQSSGTHQNSRDKNEDVEWINGSVMMQHSEPPPPYSPPNVLGTHIYSQDIKLPLNMPPEYSSTSNLELLKDSPNNRHCNISQSISESNLMKLGRFNDTERVNDVYKNNFGSPEETKDKMRPMHWLRRFLPKERKIKEKKRHKRKAVDL